MRIIAAAAFYFLIVFGVGFLLGPVRVFWLERRLGEAIATLCEAPFLLIAIVLAARWLPGALGLKGNVASLAKMGIVALFLQQLADFAVSIVLRGSTPCQHFVHLATAAGLIYVALLIAFAAMPVLANWPQRPEARPTHAALRAVKVIHTLVWALFVSCILAIPIFAWRGQFGSVVVLTILVFIEITVLITNGWRCPLTDVAARYTDSRSDNFDIYLPLWLARNNKLIFGWLFAGVLVFALGLWPKFIFSM
jgi:hypothetical protein